ncbi:alpha/beta hydrolase [Nocardioides albidus]|uniref:Alpha/beta hydrolase n=1 Tax=Nocardioides albidus TaxID=1517589 RepID=A0A5C4VS19_9ACTN|nr:alpha/beta hydrolase [Nocardioides albidus]TNM38634.1 alpha/beta hydrolase [Nocardioides albidus]
MTATASDTGPAPGPLARRHAATVHEVRGTVPLLLSHGFGTSQEMWGRLVPLVEESRSVVLMDHVGAGGSDLSAYDPRRYQTLRGYAADVADLLDELALGPVHYVGHSAGGMIGVLAALARPELFASLSLVGASPRYLDDDGYVGGFTRAGVDDLLEAMEANFFQWSRSLAPVAMANPERPELAEELAAIFARTQAQIAVDFARAIFLSDFRDELPGVSLPTHVVQAADDPMVPAAVGRFLHAAIPGSRLSLLEATGHFPHVSGPDETARALLGFLDSLALT